MGLLLLPALLLTTVTIRFAAGLNCIQCSVCQFYKPAPIPCKNENFTSCAKLIHYFEDEDRAVMKRFCSEEPAPKDETTPHCSRRDPNNTFSCLFLCKKPGCNSAPPGATTSTPAAANLLVWTAVGLGIVVTATSTRLLQSALDSSSS